MPGSRGRPKPKSPSMRRRWNWRRVWGGVAEFFRNVALISLSAPFIEPLLSGTGAIDVGRAAIGAFVGLAFLVLALILDHERSGA